MVFGRQTFIVRPGPKPIELETLLPIYSTRIGWKESETRNRNEFKTIVTFFLPRTVYWTQKEPARL